MNQKLMMTSIWLFAAFSVHAVSSVASSIDEHLRSQPFQRSKTSDPLLPSNLIANAPFLANAASAPSNILFTYGSEDVWTQTGLKTQTNSNLKIAILTIPGAGHHYDLNLLTSSDSPSVKSTRAKFLTLANSWLQR